MSAGTPWTSSLADYIHALRAERDEARDDLAKWDKSATKEVNALRLENQWLQEALREIADETNAAGEQTTVGASRNAQIARAALTATDPRPSEASWFKQMGDKLHAAADAAEAAGSQE